MAPAEPGWGLQGRQHGPTPLLTAQHHSGPTWKSGSISSWPGSCQVLGRAPGTAFEGSLIQCQDSGTLGKSLSGSLWGEPQGR